MTASGLSVAVVTDIGCKRKNNEDSVLSLPQCGLFCVADGMGGAREGQVASKALTDALQQEFEPRSAENLDLAAKAKRIHEVVNLVNAWIKKRAEDRGYAQMGSTLVVGLFDEKNPLRGMAIHAGDSRLYRYRNKTLKQFTVDHTVAELAARSDKDLPAQFRGVLTKVVGLSETVELDETPFDVAPDDLYLLCSDGLTRMIPDESIQGVLSQSETQGLDALAQQLVDEAKKAGGDDNVSVILIRTQFDRQEAEAKKQEAGEASSSGREQETVAAVPSPLEPGRTRESVESATYHEDVFENDTAEGDTPTTDDARHERKSAEGKKADIVPASLGSPGRARAQSFLNKLIVGVGLVALIGAAWWTTSHQTPLGDFERSVRVEATSPPPSIVVVEEAAQAPSAQSVPEMTAAFVAATSSPVPMPVVPDQTTTVPSPEARTQRIEIALATSSPSTAVSEPPVVPTSGVATALMPVVPDRATTAPSHEVSKTQTIEIAMATSSPSTAVSGPPLVPTAEVATAMVKQEPPPSAVQVPQPEPVKPPVESPPTNAIRSPAPVVVAQKSEAEKKKESMEKARKALADGFDQAFETGRWGALKKTLGPWADKLELLEGRDVRRATLQAWMKLWDDASQGAELPESFRLALERMQAVAERLELPLPPPAIVSGDAKERADAYCRFYRERQAALLNGIAAYADGEERRIAALGDRVGQYVAALRSFLEGASTAGGCGNICENLEHGKQGIAALKSWTQARLSSDAPIKPEDYPLKEIETVQERADAAWGQLYLLIEPLGQQVAFKRVRADEAADLRFDTIAMLQSEIVVERDQYPGVRPWRLAANLERIRTLLAEVSNMAPSFHRKENAPPQ